MLFPVHSEKKSEQVSNDTFFEQLKLLSMCPFFLIIRNFSHFLRVKLLKILQKVTKGCFFFREICSSVIKTRQLRQDHSGRPLSLGLYGRPIQLFDGLTDNTDAQIFYKLRYSLGQGMLNACNE